MRVILDANVFVSYLLTYGQLGNTIGQVVERCMLDSEIELIVPTELIEEIVTAIDEKHYLQTHVRRHDLDDLISVLTETATIVQPLSTILPLSRDPQDDYLLTHGLAEDVDFLITGDSDLLALGRIDRLCIKTAAQFWNKLESD